MDQTELLYELQTMDLRIAAAAAQVEAEGGKIQEPGAVRQARAAAGSAERQLTGLRKELRTTEQEAESLSAKKAAVHGKLYGGRVTVPRELAALEAEEAAFAKTLSQLEDRELELMSAAETEEAALVAAQRQLDSELARWRTEGAAAHEHIDQLEAEVKQVEADRASLAARISPANLASYERLKPRKANRPVAIVENNMCQMCRVTLPSVEVQHARGADPPHLCENCGRLLYVR